MTKMRSAETWLAEIGGNWTADTIRTIQANAFRVGVEMAFEQARAVAWQALNDARQSFEASVTALGCHVWVPGECGASDLHEEQKGG